MTWLQSCGSQRLECGGLNKNRLKYLNACFLASGTVWEGGAMPCHWSLAVRFQKTPDTLSVPPLCLLRAV